MKTLITFYSRTGKTKNVAKEISKIIDTDIDEIKDKENRKGIVGWMHAGRDAYKEVLTDIEYKNNPKNYDLVIIGTPIWAAKMTPAIRTYLKKNKNNFKKIAFFATSGSNDGIKTFSEMESLSKKPITTLILTNKNFKGKVIKVWEIKKIKEFCEKIKNGKK